MSSLKKRKEVDDSASEVPGKRQKTSPAAKIKTSLELDKNAHSNDEIEKGSDDGETFNDTKPAIPVEETPDQTPKPFSELGVIPELCDACEELGYSLSTPIQSACIPTLLSGRDLIGLAETGSGKTAAYTLPLLQALIEKQQALFGLVLAPTRELAYQIDQMVKALGATINVKTAVLVGGMDMMTQSLALAKRPHVIVATPGRILDHLQNTKGFSLRTLKYLVLDEADRLLDMDFGPSIDKILKNIPSGEARRTMLFSATMTSKVSALTRASLRNPVKILLSSDDQPTSGKAQTPSTLKQTYLFFPHSQKDQYLTYLLSLPLANRKVIIFVRIIAEVDRLHHFLTALGYNPVKLHGRLSQPLRLASLNKFRSHQRHILISTDVAARGLDIPNVDCVLNFDLPDNDATYIHRVGRTARAGKAGMAINLVTQYEVELIQRIERRLGFKMEEFEGGVGKELIEGLEGSVREAQAVAVRKGKDDREKNGKGGKFGGSRGQRGARKREDWDLEEE